MDQTAKPQCFGWSSNKVCETLLPGSGEHEERLDSFLARRRLELLDRDEKWTLLLREKVRKATNVASDAKHEKMLETLQRRVRARRKDTCEMLQQGKAQL